MTEIETQDDLANVTNGTLLQYQGETWLKTRTDKDRYGTVHGINVVNVETDAERTLRFVNDGVILTERNPIAFGGDPSDPSTVERVGVDKDQLRDYLNIQ